MRTDPNGDSQIHLSDFDRVIGINRRSVFNLGEAKALLPLVLRLTKSYSERVQVLIKEIESRNADRLHSDGLQAEAREAEVGRLIESWQTKIQKLGGLPKGLWIVDFDSGDGYYCWKYPEPSIRFWHRYRDGFTKRVELRNSHFSEIERVELNEVPLTT